MTITKNKKPNKEIVLKKGILRLYVFNVGQGDHLFIKLPDNSYGIVDFYYDKKFHKYSPARYYFENLKRCFPEEDISISFICLSHPDSDHLEGLESFISWLEKSENKIEQLWLFGAEDDPLNIASEIQELINLINKKLPAEYQIEKEISELAYLARLKAIKKLKTFVKEEALVENIYGFKNLLEAHGDDEYQISAFSMGPLTNEIKKFKERILKKFFNSSGSDDEVNEKDIDKLVSIIHSLFEGKNNIKADKNLISAILLLQFKQFKFLFAGDTSSEILEKCIDSLPRVQERKPSLPTNYGSHFVKGIHHGSKYSSSHKIWDEIIHKEYKGAVQIGISAGKRKNYNHPHWETLSDLLETATKNQKKIQLNSTNLNFENTKSKGYAKEEEIDWIFEDIDEYISGAKNSVDLVGKDDKISKNKRIGAIIYEFDPNADEGEDIKVIFGIHSPSKM